MRLTRRHDIRTGTPVPRFCIFEPPYTKAEVRFDRLLTPGLLNAGSWWIDKTNNRYAAAEAKAKGVSVFLRTYWFAEQIAHDYAHYAATPADLLGYDGSPVAAFHTCPIQ